MKFPDSRLAAGADVVIETYFHIITSSGGYGVYSNSNLGLQMQVLNDAFAGSGFSFDYGGGANVQTVANDKWHIHNFGQSQANIDMWKELKVDGPNILNVYVLPELYDNGGQIFGYANFPSNYAAYPLKDGIHTWTSSMTNGGFTDYEEGDTLVHMVGHWMGLWHTFQGGCLGIGDEVADTPSQLKPQWATCNPDLVGNNEPDSCPQEPGNDPIRNYMSSSYDICKNTFSALQRVRMQKQWGTYRDPDGLGVCYPPLHVKQLKAQVVKNKNKNKWFAKVQVMEGNRLPGVIVEMEVLDESGNLQVASCVTNQNGVCTTKQIVVHVSNAFVFVKITDLFKSTEYAPSIFKDGSLGSFIIGQPAASEETQAASPIFADLFRLKTKLKDNGTWKLKIVANERYDRGGLELVMHAYPDGNGESVWATCTTPAGRHDETGKCATKFVRLAANVKFAVVQLFVDGFDRGLMVVPKPMLDEDEFGLDRLAE